MIEVVIGDKNRSDIVKRSDRHTVFSCLAMGLHSANCIGEQDPKLKQKALTQVDSDKIQKAKLKRQAKNHKRLANK